MSEITETNQRVFAIRHLLELGYKDKQVCMIAQAKQPYVSKIRHRNIHADTQLEEGEEFRFTERQLARKEALDQIISLPEFVTYGDTNEHDAMYIQVLKFFLADREDVYNLYFHISKKHFGRLWSARDVDIRMFDAENIGVDQYDYLDLIIDYFI